MLYTTSLIKGKVCLFSRTGTFPLNALTLKPRPAAQKQAGSGSQALPPLLVEKTDFYIVKAASVPPQISVSKEGLQKLPLPIFPHGALQETRMAANQHRANACRGLSAAI